MPSIITQQSKIEEARSFVDRYNASPSIENNLYIGIGKSTAWPDEAAPPAPTQAPQEITDFWTDLIGIQKVATTEISLAVPRRNWTSGTEYFLFDPTNVSAYNQAFYVVNSENNVYQCVGKTAGGITAVTEPTGHNSGVDIVTGDGYTWRFLYDIGLSDSTNMISDDWIVVNWGDSISANQTAYGDEDAYKLLGAKYVLVKGKLDDSGLPVSTTYRQVAIISNPLLSDGTTPATASIVLAAALTADSGDLIHLDNRISITRNTGQSEDIKLVIAN